MTENRSHQRDLHPDTNSALSYASPKDPLDAITILDKTPLYGLDLQTTAMTSATAVAYPWTFSFMGSGPYGSYPPASAPQAFIDQIRTLGREVTDRIESGYVHEATIGELRFLQQQIGILMDSLTDPNRRRPQESTQDGMKT